MTKSEFSIKKSSPICGKTKSQIEKEFEVKVEHGHNPKFSKTKRVELKSNTHITDSLILKVSGSWDKVAQFIKVARS